MKDFVLIFTCSDPWEIWHRRIFVLELARQIKKSGGQILCLEPPIFSLYTLIKYPERIIKWLKRKYRFRKVYDNIWSFAPFTLEHIVLSARFKLLKIINKYLIKNQLSKYIKKIDGDNSSYIFILHRPELGFLKGILNINKIVYDCWDEFTVTHDDNKLKVLGNIEREAEFSKQCDLIITNSSKLNDKLTRYNSNTFEVVCAYNDNIFKNAKYFKVDQLEKLKGPIIGYIGNVRNWIDFKLIEEILKARKDWNIVFVGSILNNSKKDVNILRKKYHNFICTGYISYESFPAYLKYFNIGIIPFKNNEFINNTNPNKFYEYIAVRVPVVSVPIDHLKRHFSSVVRFASTPKDFINEIDNLLLMNEGVRKELLTKMKRIASENTWEIRSKYFIGLLNKYVFDGYN